MSQEISLEKIVDSVVREVIKALQKEGVKVVLTPRNPTDSDPAGKNQNYPLRNKTENMDMSLYRTPVLTENRIQKLHPLTGEIIVPKGTVITPKARELIQSKQILVTYK
ncbi:hypothetical protein JW824_03455 [bacterium]|nr:hypothetical protein [bacterium]RQV97752.1 MAG: hypothetical protein EH221_03490 [bacterium]